MSEQSPPDRRAVPRRADDRARDSLDQTLAGLGAVVEGNAALTRRLADEVDALRATVVPREEVWETVVETTRRRRMGLLGVAIFAALLIWTHDEHVERCGPGHRAEIAIEVLLRTDPDDADVSRKIVEAIEGSSLSRFCDASFPLHTHDSEPWPSGNNILGLGVWGLLVGAGYVITRRPPRRIKSLYEDLDEDLVHKI